MSHDVSVNHGMNLRDALTAASGLGCDLQEVRGTGEIRIRHAVAERPVVLNRRRKDAPRALTALLLKLTAARAGKG